MAYINARRWHPNGDHKKFERSWKLLAAAVLLLMVSGCVQESDQQGTRVYKYAIWVPGCALLGGLIAAPVGWALRKKSARLGWGLLVVGPVGAIIAAPSLFLDQVTVNNNEFDVRSGIFGLTAVHHVEFKNVTTIKVTSEQVSGRRGSKRTNYYLLCEQKSGGSAKVPMNNDLCQAAAQTIFKEAAAHNIPIHDATGGQ